jgi:transposase InsO family protein
VAVDYFTKWTEAEPLASITAKKSLDFVVKNIVCRYGIPRKIVSDNGTQFESDEFTGFCEKNGIIKSFSSVVRPQGNGQVEAVNKNLKSSMKKRLEEAKGRWPQELPNVLWSYRTTARTSTGHTPFALAYGCEAMLPVEVEVPTRRRETYKQDENLALLEESLDLIKDARRNSQLINAAYQQKMTQYFNKKV